MDNATRILLLLLVAVVLAALPARAQDVEYPDPAELVDAALVPETAGVQPGTPLTVGLRMRVKEGWHTYWKNPGDSGMPTTIAWTLPDGFAAGEIQWPYPHTYDESGIVTYAFGGEIVLLTDITPPADLEPGTRVTLAARADWLVCEDICLPGGADLTLDLPVTDGAPAPHPVGAEAVAAARAEVPRPPAAWTVTAAQHGEGYLIRLLPGEGASTPDPQVVAFYASEPNTVQHDAAQLISRDGAAYLVSVERSEYASAPAARLRGVLVAEGGWQVGGSVPALAVDVPVEEQPGAAADPGRPAGGLTLVWALVFAFFGGMILNLMPCVFPVLSIKVLGFVQSADDEPVRARRHGYMFALGVVLSFLALAAVLLALRAGGERLGWGFQLQSPGFVALMAFVIFALGLSMLGVFEIGTSLMRLGAASNARAGYAASFWSGVLATAVATPCTAPFMGPALGYALIQPAASALLIFAVLGSGMALPYVLLTLAPGLLRRLPRPGPWMETFKQAMAFPLLATVIWLVWVFAQQTGVDGAAYLLLGLLLAGLAAWLIGRWPAVQVSTGMRVATRALALAALAGAALLTLSAAQMAPPAAGTTPVRDGGIAWQPYQADAIEGYRNEGRPVFVDFTAAWCLSCKVNERVAFGDRDVQERFRALDVVMMKADWTSRDPEITDALESFGRSGVPLYVLYMPDPGAAPVLLPEILSPGIVLDALDELESDVAGPGSLSSIPSTPPTP